MPFRYWHSHSSIAVVDSELTFKTISYGLVGLLWVTTLVLLWISIQKERRYAYPHRGVLGLTVVVLCLCAFIVLVAAYVQKARSIQKLSQGIDTGILRDELQP